MVGDMCVEDGDGIDMGRNDGSSDNEVSNNTISGNEGNGIHIVSGVSGNSLSGNSVCENGDVDIYDGDATSGADNTCDTTANYRDTVTGMTNCRYNCSAVSTPDIDLIPIILDKKITMSASAIDQPYDIEVTIENSGSDDVAGPFNVTLLNEDYTTIASVNVPALGGDKTTKVNLAWTPPAVGNYTLMVYVDFPPKEGGVIKETNEANNIANVEIQVEVETVPTPTPEEEQPAVRSGGGGGSGSRRITEGEDIFSYESSTGAGTETAATTSSEATKEVPVNETKQVKEEKKMGTGHPFGEGEMTETVKVVAPVFLVVALITIVIVLFYLGYHKEKKMHRRRR